MMIGTALTLASLVSSFVEVCFVFSFTVIVIALARYTLAIAQARLADRHKQKITGPGPTPPEHINCRSQADPNIEPEPTAQSGFAGRLRVLWKDHFELRRRVTRLEAARSDLTLRLEKLEEIQAERVARLTAYKEKLQQRHRDRIRRDELKPRRRSSPW